MNADQKKKLIKALIALVALGQELLGGGEEAQAETTPTEEKKPRAKKQKAAAAQATEVEEPEAETEVEAEDQDEDDLGDVEEETQTEVTPAIVREELVRIAQSKGKKTAYELLAKHGGGAAKIADVKPAMLSKVYEALKKTK